MAKLKRRTRLRKNARVVNKDDLLLRQQPILITLKDYMSGNGLR